ncbi:MAG: TetR/AcrR family transcriptional regulator [Nannocystaceae bacterium]|nr:TetR/AcrR family transcriptional regulator [Nannocystaceae bacterium]
MTGLGDIEAFREAIIGASLELGQAFGEDGVTMRAIATRLGTSATTLYTCFDSKAAIMRELRMRGLVMLARSLLEGLALPDAREAMHDVSRRYVAFARDNPWLYTLLFMDETTTTEQVLPTHRPLLLEIEASVRERIASVYEQLSGRPPAHARRFLVKWWAAMHGASALLITRRVRADHPLLPVDDVEQFVDEYVVELTDGLLRPR